jgi:hypothetical protein
MSIVLYLNAEEKRSRIGFYLFFLLMIATWLGSNSRAGYLGVSFGLIMLAILFRKNIRRDYRKILAMFGGLILVVIVMNFASDGRTFSQFSRLNPANEEVRLEQISEKEVRIEDIVINGNIVNIKTENDLLTIDSSNNNLLFLDELGDVLEVTIGNDTEITINDPTYDHYGIVLDRDNRLLTIDSYGKTIPLYYTPDGFRMIGPGKSLIIPSKPEYVEFFEGREKFASSRGYIWSRSIPMLKETIVLGYGPDTYTIEFPQDDVVGKLNSFSSYRTVVDKPHNMYLQIGINTGVISLLAMLSVFMIYLVDSLRILYRKKIESYMDYIGLGLFIGVASYLVAAMFNDQIISVAPLFYGVLGLGMAVNKINRIDFASEK